MNANSISMFARLRRRLSRTFSSRRKATELQEEILYLSSRTESLSELLTVFPRRISDALGLSSFHIFLRAKDAFVLQADPGKNSDGIRFPASSATVLRMKRDRRPTRFMGREAKHAQLDGWQVLATPFEIDTLAELGTEVLLPLEGRTGLIGFVALGRSGDRPFENYEMRFLRELGPQLGRGLETAHLVHSVSEQAVEQARVNREFELAREVQERLLPGTLPLIAGVDLAVAYRSAEQVGGDYYDVLRSEDGSLCMVIADVSGKGVSAALLMAALSASLRALMLESMPPITILIEQLNDLLHRASATNRYATLFCCFYNPRTCSLTYVNAGHNPPVLLHANGTMTRLTCGGTVVGLLSQATYESGTLTLESGDALVAYTDGVTEATNLADEEWGEQGLEAVLARSYKRGSPRAKALVDEILAQLQKFASGARQRDDITLVVLKRT